jgi:putative membrane protein
MPSDPDQPVLLGRQRTHPLTVVLGLGGVAIGAVLGLFLGAGVVGLLVGFGGALRFVGWFFRTYELRTDDMVIAAGVLTRREQVVPYQRVQQIDFHRGLVAQLLGLTELRIDTAGSKRGRVQLAYLDHRVAESIREWVLARRAVLASADTGNPDRARRDEALAVPEAQFSLSAGQLLLAGAISTGPVATLALFCVATPVVAPLVLAGRDTAIRVLIGVGIAAVLVAIVMAFSAVGYLLTYARFRVSVIGEDLHVDYGLLEVQHLTVPRERVQHVSITDNPLRRALGLMSLTVHSAASSGAEHATNFSIVALPRARLAEVLAFALPRPARESSAVGTRAVSPGAAMVGPWRLPELVSRPPAARRRAVVRRSLLLAIPGAVVATIWFPIGVASLLAAGLGLPWGRLAHRRAGHAVTGVIAVLGAGVVAHRVQIVPVARVQSSRTRRSPLQRRSDLASLSLDVAGGAPGLYDMDATTAARLRSTVALIPRG